MIALFEYALATELDEVVESLGEASHAVAQVIKTEVDTGQFSERGMIGSVHYGRHFELLGCVCVRIEWYKRLLMVAVNTQLSGSSAQTPLRKPPTMNQLRRMPTDARAAEYIATAYLDF